MIKHDHWKPEDDSYNVELRIGLEWSHVLCHEGLIHGFYSEALNMADQADSMVLVRVGAKPLHVVLDLGALAGLLRGRIYRSPAISSPGTPLSWGAFNDLPESDKPKLTTLFTGPTISGGNFGTQIVNRLVLAAAQGNSKITSQVRLSIERIWRPNTDYLIRQTALAAGVTMTLVGAAYEEEV